jgi:hypothetical protein
MATRTTYDIPFLESKIYRGEVPHFSTKANAQDAAQSMGWNRSSVFKIRLNQSTTWIVGDIGKIYTVSSRRGNRIPLVRFACTDGSMGTIHAPDTVKHMDTHSLSKQTIHQR